MLLCVCVLCSFVLLLSVPYICIVYIIVYVCFPYLGSVVASSGRIYTDVDDRIAKASKAFNE